VCVCVCVCVCVPPIDMKDTTRCEFKNSAMGQSNAAKDKLYDLRQVVN
jgi:hypothetical protein